MRFAPLLTGTLILTTVFTTTSRAAEWPVYASVGTLSSGTNAVASTGAGAAAFSPTLLPSELPLNGLPFDDDDFGWTATLGYQFTDYFAVEMGYQDLGTYGGAIRSLGTFALLPPPAQIDAKGLIVGSQLSYPLTNRLRATWHLGLVRAEFEAAGSVVVATGPFLPNDPPDAFVSVPFADPGDETGYLLGFGARWSLNEHFEAELAYSRQDLEVLEFNSIGLRLIGRL